MYQKATRNLEFSQCENVFFAYHVQSKADKKFFKIILNFSQRPTSGMLAYV